MTAKETAIDFFEWCASYHITGFGDKWVSSSLWAFGHHQKYTLEELFDKFLEEKKMKTPIQELLKLESDLTQMFDSDHRVAMAILEKIRSSHKDLLDKEKEVIINAFISGDNSDCLREQDSILFAEEYYNKTFNTKEK